MVRYVQINVGVKKRDNDIGATFQCSPSQEGCAISTKIKESGNQARVLLASCPIQRGISFFVNRVRIGAGFEEGPNVLNIPHLRRRVQGRCEEGYMLAGKGVSSDR